MLMLLLFSTFCLTIVAGIYEFTGQVVRLRTGPLTKQVQDIIGVAEHHGVRVLRAHRINNTCTDLIVHLPSGAPGHAAVRRLTAAGAHVEVLASAAQMNIALRQERARPRRLASSTAHAGDADGLNSPWHDVFHPLEEVHDWMRRTATALPAVASLVHVGKSHENRSLLGLKISGHALAAWHKHGIHNASKKTAHLRRRVPLVVVNGAIHGREWITCAALQYFIAALLAHPAADDANTVREMARNYTLQVLQQPLGPNGTQARYKVDVLVVPVANPDGYKYTWEHDRFWRRNRMPNPVDLARNFPTGWLAEGNASSMTERTSMTYRGKRPLSEPESAALARFLTKHAKQGRLAAYADVHAQAQAWLVPFAFTHPKTSDYPWQLAVGQRAVRAAEAVAMLPGHACKQELHQRKCKGWVDRAGVAPEMIGYGARGVPNDWVYQKLGVGLSLVFEMRAGDLDWGPDSGFIDSPDRIVPLAQETAAALGVLLVEAARDHHHRHTPHHHRQTPHR